ncbi:fibronectin type III domain-containing protein 5 isoform X2 [Schistocerca gregaria]|uniref:fibronectin type III domain-containing protein 5 isoform X2 n=1 Tax=Schistocerca gregaria TaxID=7010 RepID=UPI00211E6162|nr:fibronectin type III domain-containing protein 5 isoform X2 [Schistocerca gregaria]XP_049861128.1 fibronectin type III domain-containing protein 5 isoform X2 [Schistocerca gregaria]
MVLWAALLVLHGAGCVGSMPGASMVPENITVMFLSPTTIKVSWATTSDVMADKFDVMYKPTDASYRVVTVVAGNSRSVALDDLKADTQYQLTVTAVRAGRKFRSRAIVFRTLEIPRTSPQKEGSMATPVTEGGLQTEEIIGGPPDDDMHTPPYIQVRGVEVGIVLLVLVVWAGAIALFFNRWGKIRMLLPYQPDYKEQLKVPGPPVGSGCSQGHGTSQACPQHLHWSTHQRFDMDPWIGRSRPRVNSAIFISSGVRDSEFVQHQPFRSEMGRRTRSAENIPMSGMREGLPILSVSAPPPQENNQNIQCDETL